MIRKLIALLVLLWLAIGSMAFANEFTDKVQTLIDTNQPVALGAGEFELDRPLVVPARFGFVIVGVNSVPSEQGTAGTRTHVKYTGPAGQPMVICYGAHVQLDGVGFDCNKLATCAWHFRKDARADNYASGKFTCPLLCVENATVAGIICGEQVDDHHCDTILVGTFFCRHCPRALLVNNLQSMIHKFGYVDAFGVPVVFEYAAGGCLDAETVFCTFGPSCVLKINGEASHGSGFGRDNAHWQIGFVKGDQQAQVTLLTQTGKVFDALVVFESARLATPAANLISVSGPIQVDVRNAWRIPKRSIAMTRGKWSEDGRKWFDAAPMVSLDHCRLESENQAEAFAADYAGRPLTRDCSVGQLKRLNDWTPQERK